jgi:hypothetical protein
MNVFSAICIQRTSPGMGWRLERAHRSDRSSWQRNFQNHAVQRCYGRRPCSCRFGDQSVSLCRLAHCHLKASASHNFPAALLMLISCAFWCADRTASKFITAQLACSVQSRGRTLWETASSTSTNTHCGIHCGTQMEHAPLTGCLTWSQKLCCIIYQRMPWTASANFAAKKHSKRVFLWKSQKIFYF